MGREEAIQVFIVTEGEYSDYHIIAVFTDKDKANELAALLGGRVEEKTTTNTIQCTDPEMDFFRIEMKKDGTVRCCTMGSRLVEKYDIEDNQYHYVPRKGYILLRTHKNSGQYLINDWGLCWANYAKSEIQAIQSVNKIRRQILAGQRPSSVDFGNRIEGIKGKG